MKILLQNSRSKLYFCLLDTWVSDPRAAFDFRHSHKAMDFVNRQELKDVQLVIKFEDSHWDEIVPLPVRQAREVSLSR